jgi:hypothetical protein
LPCIVKGVSVEELMTMSQKSEKAIKKNFRRNGCYDKNEDYNVQLRFRLRLTDETKDAFANDKLLENLAFIKRKGLAPKIWVDYEIYTDSEGIDLVAGGESYGVMLGGRTNPHGIIDCYDTGSVKSDAYNLVQFIRENEVELFFHIDQIMPVDFGIKGDVIHVIFKHEEKYHMTPLDDFVKDNWDYLYEGAFSPLLKDHLHKRTIVL